MKSRMMKEDWMDALEATRKESVPKQEGQKTSMISKFNHIDSVLTGKEVATGTASYEALKAVENNVRKKKVEEIKKVAEEKARQEEEKTRVSYARAARKEEEGKKTVEEAN